MKLALAFVEFTLRTAAQLVALATGLALMLSTAAGLLWLMMWTLRMV